MTQSDSSEYRVGFTMYGLPLIGKGTQGELAQQRFPAIHYAASGDMVRSYVAGPALDAAWLGEWTAAGNLVEDAKMLEIFDAYRQEQFKASGKPFFLMDGMPRTEYQAQELENGRIPVKGMLYFSLEGLSKKARMDILLPRQADRVQKRAAAGKPPRTDDTPEALDARVDEYDTVTPRVLEFYRDSDVPIIVINPLQSIEAVGREVTHGIDRLLGNYHISHNGLYHATPKVMPAQRLYLEHV
jgi:adenylate kinase family enzyme